MKKNIFFSLLVGMMALCGCRNNMYNYTPNDNLYKFCAFDSSSYWIYEDSATHKIDSVVAQKLEQYEYHTNVEREYNHGKLFTFQQDYIIINTEDNTTVTEHIMPIVGFAKPEDSGTNLNADELYTIIPNYYNDDITFARLNFYYMNISIPSENRYEFFDEFSIGTLKYSEHFDNITINNRSYQDVKKIEYCKKIDNNSSIICYWANGVGMVRREYHSADSIVQVKNLIRYNVINVSNQYR